MRTARRTLLACLPAALAPATAQAFRQEVPGAELATDYAAACDAAAMHAALREELDRLLGGQPPPPGLDTQLAALARCPFCGCVVTDAAGAAERDLQPAPRPG